MASSTTRRRVLVVDDVPTNIRMLHAILESEHDVIGETDPRRAVEVAVAQAPDIILMDVMMPYCDGFTVCRLIKADPRLADIPVIFITALNDVEDETTGFAVGGVDYIIQPVSPEIVRARVRLHLRLMEQQEALRHMSMVDGLTGVANRRRFDQTLETEWRRCRRNQAALSLILADMDCFHSYNERFGHLAGDDCLKQVADTLAARVMRPGDLLARLEGAAFGCLLPETPPDGVAAVASHLRAAVEQLGISHPASPLAGCVTISIGAASVIPDDARQPTELYHQAAQLLRDAKARGRNRVSCGGPSAGAVVSAP